MSDFAPVVVTQGNVGSFVDVIRDQSGNAVNLTGCSVQFVFQNTADLSVAYSGAATITNAANGAVSFATMAGQTATPGSYEAQWQVTFPNTSVIAYPLGIENGNVVSTVNVFQILAALPITRPVNVTLISDLYETVRAVLGDFGDGAGNYRYQDSSIDSVVRTVVKTGGLGAQDVQYGVTGDRKGIAPAFSNALDLAVLVYKAAKMFLMPDAAEYRFRTRALSESFGAQKHFIFDLENKIEQAEFGGGVWTFQSFYGWVNATTGLNIWTLMTDMNVKAPVASVTISRAGIVVNRA